MDESFSEGNEIEVAGQSNRHQEALESGKWNAG